MSLNRAQQRQTRAELAGLWAQLDQDAATVEQDLGLSPGGLDQALKLDADPITVWRVRDFLVALARARGIAAPEFSSLNEANRRRAEGWFGPWSIPQPR